MKVVGIDKFPSCPTLGELMSSGHIAILIPGSEEAPSDSFSGEATSLPVINLRNGFTLSTRRSRLRLFLVKRLCTLMDGSSCSDKKKI